MRISRRPKTFMLALLALGGVAASCANGGNEGGGPLLDPAPPTVATPEKFPNANPGAGAAAASGVGGAADGGQGGALDDGGPPTVSVAGQPGMVPEPMPMPTCTEGASCGARTCGDFGACSYTETCAQGGTHTRPCNDWVCKSGMCSAVPVTESSGDGCGRATNGASCGSSGCTGVSCEGWANGCDTERDGSSTCHDNKCSNGQCTYSEWTNYSVCETRGVACQPGGTNGCEFDRGDGCVCPGHQACSSDCTWGACLKSVGNCLC